MGHVRTLVFFRTFQTLRLEIVVVKVVAFFFHVMRPGGTNARASPPAESPHEN